MSDAVQMSREELETLLTESSRRGAREAVVTLLGIDESELKDVKKDMADLKDLLDAWRGVKSGVAKSAGRFLFYAGILLVVLVASKIPAVSWNPFSQ